MKFKILLSSTLLVFILGCHQYDNFTTYFNTYYNMNRLLHESEQEFEYQDEKKRVKPRVYVPDYKLELPKKYATSMPPFLDEFIVTRQKRQPVKVKLDSMIIKGSKILAKHPKSDYIEGTLYLMATSYFYQNLWLNTQIKCGELIDRFPDGELSPDAHILLAKTLLIQRKFEAGKLILSRTVDIAWQLKRYDILSEAFRIQAELSMFLEEYDEAVKPYKQAIIQADDDLYRAKWQFDLAALVFRMGKFEKAEKLFRDVHRFSPDYVTQFEAFLYQASSLARIGKYEEAEEILEDLETDGKYEDWISNVFAERMNIYRLKEMDEDFNQGEYYSDTSFVGSDAIAGMYFERGLDYFNNDDFANARLYFGKSRGVKNPASKQASSFYKLLDQWNRSRAAIIPKMKKIEQDNKLSKVEEEKLAFDLYEMGRVQERLGNGDSAEYYYDLSTKYANLEKVESARFFYAKARFYEESEPLAYDSLMEFIIERYPRTEYGQDAIQRMGYTENFLIDSVGELYNSGFRLWKNKEYSFAINQLSKLFNYYPESKLAPKSIYTIAWIYEKDINRYDIAFDYYKLLFNLYPQSEYASEVNRLVQYTMRVKNEEPIPDSLRDRPITNYFPKVRQILQMAEAEQEQQAEETKKKSDRPSSINSDDLLSDPFKIFDDLKESATDTDELLEEPKSMFDKFSSPDSLMNLLPGINIEDPFKDLKKSSKDSTDNKEKEEILPKEEKEKKK